MPWSQPGAVTASAATAPATEDLTALAALPALAASALAPPVFPAIATFIVPP
jgi:hypothetical protein